MYSNEMYSKQTRGHKPGSPAIHYQTQPRPYKDTNN